MVSIAHIGKPITQSPPVQLATALTTGNSGWVRWTGDTNAMIEVSGVFDGATVNMSLRHKNRPSVVISARNILGTAISTTTSGIFTVPIPANYEIQINTTGGGGTQSINAYIN